LPTLSPFNFPWVQNAAEPKVKTESAFVYLPFRHPLVHTVIESLRNAGLRLQAYLPGIDRETAEDFRIREIIVHDAPVDLSAVLPTARLIAHQGGLATTLCALLSATPQVVLPTSLEQLVTAVGLRSFGCCSIVSGGADEDGQIIDAATKRLATSRVISTHAARAAHDVGGRVDPRSFETVVQCCLEYLR
jgi:UDP:flavonoid glycosyltransferase YjiC (YdhE family)